MPWCGIRAQQDAYENTYELLCPYTRKRLLYLKVSHVELCVPPFLPGHHKMDGSLGLFALPSKYIRATRGCTPGFQLLCATRSCI